MLKPKFHDTPRAQAWASHSWKTPKSEGRAAAWQILIVGGDQSLSFARTLSEMGASLTAHWRGLRPTDSKRILPISVNLVVVIWDRVSHPLANSARRQALARNLPVLYCRTSGDLHRKLLRISSIEGPQLEHWGPF